MKLALAIALAGCGREPIASCHDDLGGVWQGPAGSWMILDEGKDLELYPLFPDVPPGDLEVAPRVIDVHRTPSGLAGTLHRRYMRRADSCDARVPVHVTSCAADVLELVVADPVPPLSFAPCTWGRGSPSHVERWRRD